MQIYEIPILSLAQKKRFWQLGHQHWQITQEQLYENIARNIVEVLQYRLRARCQGCQIIVHWAEWLPLPLFTAVMRHLTHAHFSVQVKSLMARKLPSIIHQFLKNVPASSPHRFTFPLYFLSEKQLLVTLKNSLPPMNPSLGLLTVVPGVQERKVASWKPPLWCSAVLLADFPTMELVEQLLVNSVIQTFVGWTGIPYHLLHQMGIPTGALPRWHRLVDLSLELQEWPGSQCSGIVLG